MGNNDYKRFILDGNKKNERITFDIGFDNEEQAVITINGVDLPYWLTDIMWNMTVGLNDPCWVKMLIRWLIYNKIITSTFIGSHKRFREIMDYIRSIQTVEEAIG